MAVKGQLRQPKSPMPAQHQEKPGMEHRMKPRPKYEAPLYRPSGKLKGKVALISGGDSGIGRAVAVMFAREGARIAFTYLGEEEKDARTTIEAIGKIHGEVTAIVADVSRSSVCNDVVAQTVERYERIDILVNNAAYQHHQEKIEDLTDDQIDHTFRVNVFGYMFMARAAIPFMKPGSSIVNTGSVTGFEGRGQLVDYSATKGAVHAFTKALAQQLVHRGIRVNCVAPGPVWTPLNPSDRPASDIPSFGADTPMGRPAQPEEIAPAFVFFASEADSSFITGEVLVLYGGKTMG